jgi:hypothetical protein
VHLLNLNINLADLLENVQQHKTIHLYLDLFQQTVCFEIHLDILLEVF